MQFSILAALLLTVSAAPHVHDHQNKVQHRRRALLHDDLMALYVASPTTTSSASETSATATASVGYHGPYANNVPHGGNPNVLKAVEDVTTTSADAAEATTSVSDDSSSTVAAVATNIAAASRPSTPYTHPYDNDDDTDADVSEDNSDHKGPVPAWAIALVTIVSVVIVAVLTALFVVRYRRSRSSASPQEKSIKKVDAEDALSSYKAFWELKRQSAGSFVSADANAQQFAGSLGRIDTLPQYEETAGQVPDHVSASPAVTPMTESAPPRGFLYQ